MTDTRSQTVVVGVDGSDCSDKALRWAEQYAVVTGASLTVAVAWHWPTQYGVPIAFTGFDPEEDARKVAEAAAATVDLPTDRVRVVVDQGAAGDVIVRAGADADLIVVGTRGHGTVAGSLLGSTSSYCVHHAHSSVVVVR